MIKLARKRRSNNNLSGFGDFDIGLGRLSKSLTLANNKMKGRMAEDSFALEQTIQGKEVRRIHKGGDFVVQDTDRFGRAIIGGIFIIGRINADCHSIAT